MSAPLFTPEMDANMPVHPYRAAIEAGAKVLRQFRDTNIDLYTDSEIVWLVYCTMRVEEPRTALAKARGEAA